MDQCFMRNIQLTTVDLCTVMGGQDEGQDGTGSGAARRETEVRVNIPFLGTPIHMRNVVEEPEAYLRCLDLMGKQQGLFSGTKRLTQRQEKFCLPIVSHG
jgi:hypothetical protein